MKKVLFILPVIILAACGKDEPKEPTTSTLMVNVSYKYVGTETNKTASPSLVMLYKEKSSEFDFEKSVSSMANNQKMTFKNGSAAIPVYTSDSFSGINTFEDINNGAYTIIVFYKPDGYSWPMFYFYGYKEISLTKLSKHDFVFIWGDIENDGDAGKFVQK